MANHSFLDNFVPILMDPPASQVSAQTTYIAPFNAALGNANRFAFLVSWGAVGTSIDAAVLQATDAAGAGEKAITGAVMTLTATTNSFMVFDLGPGALDLANGFNFISCSVTVVGTVLWQVLGFYHNLREPGTQAQDATLAEDVRVYFQS